MTKNVNATKRTRSVPSTWCQTRMRRYGWMPFVVGLTCVSPIYGVASAQDSDTNVKARTQQSDQSGEEHSEGPEQHANDMQRAVEKIFDEPLSGVVVNRTVTVLGKEFYRHFANIWRYSPQSNRYSISIHERPSARFGSEVWVLYRQQRIFHTFLPPARPATKEISQYAVEYVIENLARRELERFTTPDPDLGPEEL